MCMCVCVFLCGIKCIPISPELINDTSHRLRASCLLSHRD